MPYERHRESFTVRDDPARLQVRSGDRAREVAVVLKEMV